MPQDELFWRDEQGVKTVLQKTITLLSYAAKRRILLTIAGFDPSAGAGISADLKVFAAHGAYGMACITALTIQSTARCQSGRTSGCAIVAATLEMLAEDVSFSGIKVGMLANGEIAEVVNNFLKSLRAPRSCWIRVAMSFSGLRFAGLRWNPDYPSTGLLAGSTGSRRTWTSLGN